MVIDCAPLLFLDVAGMATLKDLRRDYRALDTLRKGGFLGEEQGAENELLFPSVHSAVEAACARREELLAADSAL